MEHSAPIVASMKHITSRTAVLVQCVFFRLEFRVGIFKNVMGGLELFFCGGGDFPSLFVFAWLGIPSLLWECKESQTSSPGS